MSSMVIKHNDAVLGVDILGKIEKELPEVHTVGLVTNHVLHIRKLQANSSNDSPRVASITLQSKVNRIVFRHPNP